MVPATRVAPAAVAEIGVRAANPSAAGTATAMSFLGVRLGAMPSCFRALSVDICRSHGKN